MKKTHWELHYKKNGEDNWTYAHGQIRGPECINMVVERKYAKERFDSEVKLVRVEITEEYFDEPV